MIQLHRPDFLPPASGVFVSVVCALLALGGGISCAGPATTDAQAKAGNTSETTGSADPSASSPTKSDSEQSESPDGQEGDGDTAEDAAAKAPEEGPVIAESVTKLARTRFTQALGLMTEDPSRALQHFDAAIDESPEFHLAHYNRGVLLDRAGEQAKAKAAYIKVLEVHAGYPPAVVGLASIMEREGHPEGAEKLLKKSAAENRDAWEMRAALAQVWARMGNLEQARTEAISVLKGDERNASAMVALGMVFRRQKMYELSTLALDQALDIDNMLGSAYNELGLVLVALDEKAKAVQAFERAAEASPNVAAMHNNLGVLRTDVGAFKAAVDAIEKATKLRPDVGAYYLNLGNALRGDQRYADAAKAYEKSLEIDSASKPALFNLGVLYLDNELPGMETIARYQASIAYLEKYAAAVKVKPAERKAMDEYLATAKKSIEREEKAKERAARRKVREAERREKMAQDAAEEAAKAAAGGTSEGASDGPGNAPDGASGEGSPAGGTAAPDQQGGNN